MALSARGVDHAFVDLKRNVSDMTYDEYQAAFLDELENEIPGDEQ
jgi:hypothetical protein